MTCPPFCIHSKGEFPFFMAWGWWDDKCLGGMPPRHLSGDLIRCPAIQLGMGTHRVVVFPPVSQNLSGMAERREQRLVEAFIPQPAVETFDKPVLLRFHRCDIMSFNLHLIRPFQDGMGCELRTVAHQEAPASVMPIWRHVSIVMVSSHTEETTDRDQIQYYTNDCRPRRHRCRQIPQ